MPRTLQRYFAVGPHMETSEICFPFSLLILNLGKRPGPVSQSGKWQKGGGGGGGGGGKREST